MSGRCDTTSSRAWTRAIGWLPALVVMGLMASLAAAAPARAEATGEYHQAARFGGFDANAPNGSLTPGKFYEPTGFAVDAQEGNDIYVADRTSTVGSNPAHWRIQKLSSTGAVLGTTTFTLPGGLEEPSMIAGLAVDHRKGQASGRLYALVMGPAKTKTYHRHATQAQEVLAWSTAQTGGGEIVAAPGLNADPLGSTGGVVSKAKQLEEGAPLYDPQGIVVDRIEETGVENPVLIEATNPTGLRLNANKEAINEKAGIEGALLFELEEKGETVVQQVATQASGGKAIGAPLKRWPGSSSEPGSQQARELGPLGIFDTADGSIAILLNARLASVDSDEHVTSAEVIRLTDKLEAPVVVNNAEEDPQQERRAIMGLDPGPFFTDPNLPLKKGGPREGGGLPPFELANAGPEVTELEDGLYAADLRFEPTRRSGEELEGGPLPIWLSLAEPEWRKESGDANKTNVGIRLLRPDSKTERISGAKGESILGTLGNETRGSPCDIGSEEPALAAGAGNTLWVLDRGPTAATLGEGLGLKPGREIIELEPGGASETSGCPQPSSEQFRMGRCAASQSATEPLKVPRDSTLVFDASTVRLTHGLPFAYEWKVEYRGEPQPVEGKEKQPVIEYKPEKEGLYTVSVTLWNDYGPHTLEAATVEVTSERTAPEARFTAEPVAGTQEVTFRSTGQSGSCGPDRYYRWSWGDGTSEEDITPEATHAYAEPGAKEVTLEVVNPEYETAKSVQTVMVSALPPEPVSSSEPLPVGPPIVPPAPVRPSAGPTRVSPHASFSHGVLSLRISCPLAKLTCAGSVLAETDAAFPSAHGTAKRKSKARRLVLGRAYFSLAGGAGQTLTLHITGSAASLLKKLRRLPAVVMVTARDPAGDPGATTVHLTLVAAGATAHHARTSR